MDLDFSFGFKESSTGGGDIKAKLRGKISQSSSSVVETPKVFLGNIQIGIPELP